MAKLSNHAREVLAVLGEETTGKELGIHVWRNRFQFGGPYILRGKGQATLRVRRPTFDKLLRDGLIAHKYYLPDSRDYYRITDTGRAAVKETT